MYTVPCRLCTAACDMLIFFFSSRRRHTRWTGDWSSDVCSSDLLDVIPWLRQLGFRADKARRAAAVCESIPEASLEERVHLALSVLQPPHRRVDTSQVAAT